MELTAAQRGELDLIRSEGQRDAYARDARPPTKPAYRETRRRLEALRDAWEAVDHDTRMQISLGVSRMWDDDSDEASLPDLAPVIDDLLAGMELPGHRPEDVPGVGQATALLWSAWCARRPAGEVPIDRDAREAIGAELAALF